MAAQRMFSPTLLRATARQLVQPTASSSRAFSAARTLAVQPAQKLQAASVLTQGPYVKGTVNDATTFPTPSKTHGSYHWTFERLLSAGLIPMVAATAVTSANPILDGILSVSLVLHSHLGFDACLVDYLHERKFPVLGPLFKWVLRFASGATLYGLYEFNTNDIGLTELVKRAWTA